jgi:hypothetical protein
VGWSRNLGTCTADNVAAKLEEATTVERIDHAAKKFVRDAQLSEADQAVTAQAVEVAKVAIAQLGGVAEVWIGASSGIEHDGSMTMSLSVSCSVSKPKA